MLKKRLSGVIFLLFNIFTAVLGFSANVYAASDPNQDDYEAWTITWNSVNSGLHAGLLAKLNNQGSFYAFLSNGDEGNLTLTKQANGQFDGEFYGVVSNTTCTFKGTLINTKIYATYQCLSGDSGTFYN